MSLLQCKKFHAGPIDPIWDGGDIITKFVYRLFTAEDSVKGKGQTISFEQSHKTTNTGETSYTYGTGQEPFLIVVKSGCSMIAPSTRCSSPSWDHFNF